MDYYLKLHEIPAPSPAIRLWPWVQVSNMTFSGITHLKSVMMISVLLQAFVKQRIVSGFACTGSLWLDALFWLNLTFRITWITGSIRSIFWDVLKELDTDFTECLKRWDSKISTNNSNKQLKSSLWCLSLLEKLWGFKRTFKKEIQILFKRKFPSVQCLPKIHLASMSVSFINKYA